MLFFLSDSHLPLSLNTYPFLQEEEERLKRAKEEEKELKKLAKLKMVKVQFLLTHACLGILMATALLSLLCSLSSVSLLFSCKHGHRLYSLRCQRTLSLRLSVVGSRLPWPQGRSKWKSARDRSLLFPSAATRQVRSCCMQAQFLLEVIFLCMCGLYTP